jgi:DNA-binding transcriptional LysR family regulator
MKNIDFESYKVFYYVARYRNFTLAARSLSTSQPSVTRYMKNLEYHLGCRLFIRSTRGVTLTPEGKTLYRHVSPACKLLFKGEETLGKSLSLQSGSVYLGATETAVHCFLLDKLEQFHRAYPHVGIKITNDSTPPILSDLKNGKIDLAVVTTPVPEELRLKPVKIKEFRDVPVGGPGLIDPDGRRYRLCELSRYPLIGLSESTATYRFYSEFYLRHGMPFQPDIELATADLLLPFIQKNLGVGFVPEELASEAIKRGKVVRIELEEQIPTRYICVVRDPQNPLSAAAKQMVKILTEDTSSAERNSDD